jgi:uncharacterized membrane protein YczE
MKLNNLKELYSSKYKTKKWLPLYIFGLLLYPLGIVLTLNSGFGVSPWDALSAFTTEILNRGGVPVTFGNAVIIIGIIITLIGLIVDFKTKKSVYKTYPIIVINFLITILITFVVGATIDFWKNIVPAINQENITLRVIALLVGVVILGVGIAMYVLSNGKLTSSIDYFTASLGNVTKKEFGTIKRIIEFTLFIFVIIISLILYGKIDTTIINFGTIISVLGLGSIINFSAKYIIKYLED